MYYLLYGFFYLLSLIPLWFLHLLSDGIYFLMYYVFKYRRKVVRDNLALAFPEKSVEERLKIEKQFFKNLTDQIVESVKMISMSNTTLQKRFTGNWSLINNVKKNGKSLQMLFGHNFNWEWANLSGGLNVESPFLGVYKPIQNAPFERMMRKVRSKTGTKLLRSSKMAEDFMPFRNAHYTLALVADQNPRHVERAIWVEFFGRPTPFPPGPAKNAFQNDCSIMFGFIRKVKRGYYQVEIVEKTTEPKNYTIEELTVDYVRYLEDIIRKYPDMWLWSHRRWRKEWKPEYPPVLK